MVRLNTPPCHAFPLPWRLKTPPLPCVSTAFAAKNTAVALCVPRRRPRLPGGGSRTRQPAPPGRRRRRLSRPPQRPDPPQGAGRRLGAGRWLGGGDELDPAAGAVGAGRAAGQAPALGGGRADCGADQGGGGGGRASLVGTKGGLCGGVPVRVDVLRLTRAPRGRWPHGWRGRRGAGLLPAGRAARGDDAARPALGGETAALCLCASTAFMANAPPLPCASTAFAAERRRLCLVFPLPSRLKNTAFALCVPPKAPTESSMDAEAVQAGVAEIKSIQGELAALGTAGR